MRSSFDYGPLLCVRWKDVPSNNSSLDLEITEGGLRGNPNVSKWDCNREAVYVDIGLTFPEVVSIVLFVA